MAVSETDSSDGNSDSSYDATKHVERKERMFTKVIVRRLPPSMNKELFLGHVSPLPDYDYMYFVKADISLGEFAFARAYINFKNPSDIFIFKEKFDNYVFLDAKGNEYPAVVEFAPFSRIPRKRNKSRIDPKCGTIETDPLYLEFLESLKEEPNDNEGKMEYNIQPTLEEDKKIINTPLLDFIKQRRIDRQKMKEEKREERKRKEFERKRLKEEDRRCKRRSPHDTPKSIQILNSTKESSETTDETKTETDKPKDRKSEKYSYKTVKPHIKEFDRRPIKTDRDYRRPIEDSRKPIPRTRQRNFDKYEASNTEYRSKRDSNITLKSKKYNESYKDTEEKIIEKKVKKYSERREERKNEIKKQETLKIEKEYSKEEDNTLTEQSGTSESNSQKPETFNEDENKETKKAEVLSESETRECRRERDNDPRTQRRIRNKDRPTMALYQPGMLSRTRKNTDGESDQKSSGDKEESESTQ